MKIFDLVVIGAGPAGLMAAITASARGLKVLVLEKNDRAGVKLMMTGGGRCNLTNVYYENIKDFAAVYEKAGPFLLSSFFRFGPKETMNFFEASGLSLKQEDNGRIFPADSRARSVLDFLLKLALDNSVQFKYSSEVKRIISAKDGSKTIENIELNNKYLIKARNYIIATGGKSYPLTGSTGDAYKWLEGLGHTINRPRPGLKAVRFIDQEFKKLEGLSFSNVLLNIEVGKKESSRKIISSSQGDIIFTKDSVSGPAALNLSLTIPDTNQEKLVVIDFFPDETEEALNIRLQTIFHKGKKGLKNSLSEIIPTRFIDFLLPSLNIKGDSLANSVSKKDRELIVSKLKSFAIKIRPDEDFSQAMITIGGVSLKEIETNSFKSKLVSNLYIIGEVLDVAAPTGGYNLQLAWTSGYLAASDLLGQ